MRSRRSAASMNQNASMGSTFYVDREGTARAIESFNDFPWDQGAESLSLSSSIGIGQPVINFETDRLWHYQDPTGKSQGPFSMAQLRKWNTSGHFPPGLRVWMINEKPDESIFLTDALVGRYHKDPSLLYKSLSQVRTLSDGGDKAWDCEWGGKADTTDKDTERVGGDFDSKQIDGAAHNGHVDELMKSNGWGSSSSCSTTRSDVINSLASSLPSEKIGGSLSNQVKESPGGDTGKSETSLNSDLQKSADGQISIEHAQEKRVDSEGNSSQSSGENQRPTSLDSSSRILEPKSNGLDFLAKALGLPTDSQENSPISYNDTEAKKSASPDVPLQDSGPSCSTASSPVGSGPQLNVAPTTSEKPNEMPADQVKENQEGERWKRDQSTPNGVSHETSERKIDTGHSYEKQNDNSETNSGQSFNWRPPSSNGLDPNNSGFVSLENSLQIPNENQEIDFSCLPSSPRNSSQGELNNRAAEIKPSISLGLEDWDSGIMHASSSLKPAEVTSDHAATPTSGNWQPIVVTEPEDFTALADESVSDLLAEVEAMESLNGLASPTSPTSSLRCGAENDCFSPVRGLSPPADRGRSDAFSSGSDFQMHSQSAVTNEQLGVSHATILNPPKNHRGQTSSRVDTRPSNDSVNLNEPGSEIKPPPLPATTSWATTSSNMASIEYRGVAQGNMSMGYGTHWATPAPATVNYTPSYPGNPGIFGAQPRHGGDRYSSPRDGGDRYLNPRDGGDRYLSPREHRDIHGRDLSPREHRDFHGRDSGHSRSRSTWSNRPSMYGGSGHGGSYRAPPPKGQRVCKFYESGYCKKGSSCSYWHP